MEIIFDILKIMVGAAAVGLTLVGFAIKSRERMLKTLTDQHQEAMEQIEANRARAEDLVERVRNETGESIRGFRQQIVDLGFFIRDHYVRDKEFSEATKSVKDAIDIMDGKLEARFIRIEAQIRNNHQARSMERKP